MLTISNIPFVIDIVWVAVVPLLFRLLGPRRGALVAVVGGYLFLPYLEGPRLVPETALGTIGKLKLQGFGLIPVTKLAATGLGLWLGVLIFDRESLRRFRPHWLDVAMVVFVGLPVVSMVANGCEGWDSSVNQVFERLSCWASPYFVGRLYFGNGDGVRRIAAALVNGGLLYVPLCLFEILMGPRWYLAGLLYGQPPHMNMVNRLGGSRPEVFLTQGIEVSSWMAMATVLAVWLAFCREGWSPTIPRVPRWAPAVVLLLTTALCRGVYGYLDLAVGLVVAGLMQVSRSRWPLVALLIVAPMYTYARISERWDGHQLVALAGYAGRSDTVEYRLRAESQYIAKVKEHNQTWGFGGLDSGIYDWWAKAHLWPDGWWVHIFREGGVIGLSAFSVALFLVPVGVAAFGLPARTIRRSPISPAWGLALFVALHGFDLMQNRPLIGPSGLIGGSLVGLVLLGRASTRKEQPGSIPSDTVRDLTRFAVVMAVLATPELLQLVTGTGRSQVEPPPSPKSPEVAPVDPVPQPQPNDLSDDELARRLREFSRSKSKSQRPPPSEEPSNANAKSPR